MSPEERTWQPEKEKPYVEIVCPTCNAIYRLPDDKLPPRKATARCKRCDGKLVIDPSARPESQAAPTSAKLAPSPPERPDPSGSAPRPARDVHPDLIAFIGPNAARYLANFKKFEDRGGDRFAATWHWPAALIGFWWLLYRKLYGWALVAVVVSFIPLVNLLAIAAFGITGNYIYFRHACKKIESLRTALPDDDLSITLKQLGGVNRWVVTVGIVVGVIGTAAAIVIPLMTGG